MWLNGELPRRPRDRKNGCQRCGWDKHDPDLLPAQTYSYLLGLYLGDGCISASPRAYRLRVTLDSQYPNIITSCAAAMRAVMPRNTVLVQHHNVYNCVEVGCFSKSWPCLFPQHGPGRKHEREITLVAWQRRIVDRHPEQLIRGLIHSDGCRIVHEVGGNEYVRYLFDQVSDDIRLIFTDACNQLGIPWRQPRRNTISIARAEGIAILDALVGPKT